MQVKSFLQNFFDEMSEEDCMRVATYIRAVRYDVGESVPLKDETPEEHAAFLAEFKQLDLQGLYGFPLWEQEVHDLLHNAFRELSSIFRAYCKSLGEGNSEESKTMDIEEFHDFVVDCGLETGGAATTGGNQAVGQYYGFEHMKEQFSKADKSGKGLAGPAANSELTLYEFLNVLTRVSFWRLNPEFGELTMEHQEFLLPVPQCLDKMLRECVLPKAHRDDAAEFRAKTMQLPEVQAAVRVVLTTEHRPRASLQWPPSCALLTDPYCSVFFRSWRRAGRGCRRGSRPSRSTRTKRLASRSGCRRCRRSTSSAPSRARRAPTSSATTASARSSSAASQCRSPRRPSSMRKRRRAARWRTCRSTLTSCSSASRAAAATSIAPLSRSRWARRWRR